MRKLHSIFIKTTALFAAAFLLSGCAQSKERLEKEEAYRTIGINAMEEGNYEAAMEAFNSALVQANEIGPNEIDICFYKAAAQFASGIMKMPLRRMIFCSSQTVKIPTPIFCGDASG